MNARFDQVIKPRIQNGTTAYGGYSAGVCVATPNLRGVELVDDPNDAVAIYNIEAPWDCMNLIDYHVAPYYRSDYPESAAIDNVVD